MATYLFHLACPVCKQTEETVIDKRDPPPIIYCGNCLMEAVSMNVMKVVKVEVQS